MLRWWSLDQPSRGCVRQVRAPGLDVDGVAWDGDGRMLVGAGGHLHLEADGGWRRIRWGDGSGTL
jgi:hypothetical protein